jgi:hypothetical protein
MEFIPLPYESTVRPIKIPFVAVHQYDPDRTIFSEFPYGLGYSTNEGLDLTRSELELASFLQSWLYFGLLSRLLGKAVDQNNFRVVDHAGDAWVSAEMLTSAIEESLSSLSRERWGMLGWSQSLKKEPTRKPEHLEEEEQSSPGIITRERSLNRGKPKAPKEKGFTALECAIDVLTRLDDTFDAASSPLLAMVSLSIKVLITTVWSASRLSSGDYDWFLKPGPDGCERLSCGAQLLWDKMVSDGWCKHQISRIFRTYRYHVAYYISRLSRRTNPKVKHDNCTIDKCVGWTCPRSFQAQHLQEACTCQILGVSSSKVAAIIRKGGLPIVSLGVDKHGELNLKLHRWNG